MDSLLVGAFPNNFFFSLGQTWYWHPCTLNLVWHNDVFVFIIACTPNGHPAERNHEGNINMEKREKAKISFSLFKCKTSLVQKTIRAAWHGRRQHLLLYESKIPCEWSYTLQKKVCIQRFIFYSYMDMKSKWEKNGSILLAPQMRHIY